DEPPRGGLCRAQQAEDRKPEMAGESGAGCSLGRCFVISVEPRHGHQREGDALECCPVLLDCRASVHCRPPSIRRRDCRMGGKGGDKWTGVGCCVNRFVFPSLAKSNTWLRQDVDFAFSPATGGDRAGAIDASCYPAAPRRSLAFRRATGTTNSPSANRPLTPRPFDRLRRGEITLASASPQI